MLMACIVIDILHSFLQCQTLRIILQCEPLPPQCGEGVFGQCDCCPVCGKKINEVCTQDEP